MSADIPTPDDLASIGQLRAEVTRLRALVACVPPRALAELARVLVYGGAKHGCGAGESGGGQDAETHAAHGFLHAMNADRDVHDRDADTGALHLVHAAARALLAAEMVLAGEK